MTPPTAAQPSSQLTIEYVTKLIQAFRGESSSTQRVEESGSPEVFEAHLRPSWRNDFVETSSHDESLQIRGCPGDPSIPAELSMGFPPAESQRRQHRKFENAGIAKMRDDEKCTAAENSKYGWGLVDIPK